MKFTKNKLAQLITFSLFLGASGCTQNAAVNPANALEESVKLDFATYDGHHKTVSFDIVSTDSSGLREYRQTTTEKLREGGPSTITYTEKTEKPYIRTGNLAFDALFAMAAHESELLSVNNIRDGSYNNGNSIPCDCFVTGEKWHFVWTRDLAYAVYLKMAMLDPKRVQNSLEFKLSGYRSGLTKPEFAQGSDDGLQIIQDTGSGGSWPISTDRNTWSFGAAALLDNLEGEAYDNFAKIALKALINTIENDRKVVFDQEYGLYNGEQSFLDWREQTYATWTPLDLSTMATAKALSTNVGFYQSLVLASKLASEQGEAELSTKYLTWANQLKAAINEHLWLPEKGLYSSLTTAHFENVAMEKFDWLGQSLAIISGIASPEQSQQILANYPHGPMGAPVIFPQQPGIAVYHNRALWPFVTAFGLKAAVHGENQAVANAAYDSLIRGAALNLSNMENLEWLTGQALWEEPNDPSLNGPVINSKRQLWSVAAYLDMVISNVFGINTEDGEMVLKPFITTKLAKQYFMSQKSLSLNNLLWKNKRLNISITLLRTPSQERESGVYSVAFVKVNGKRLEGNKLTADLLNKTENQIEITLGKATSLNREINLISSVPGELDASVFAPFEPVLSIEKQGEQVQLKIEDKRNQQPVFYEVYRNGQRVTTNLIKQTWNDSINLNEQVCYSVAAVFISSGNKSHHSRVHCVDNGETLNVDSPNWQVSKEVQASDWGSMFANVSPEDKVTVSNINVNSAGTYALQFSYRNNLHNINTGITAGSRWYRVKDTEGNVVSEGGVFFPHIGQDAAPALSTPIQFEAQPGSYSVTLYDYINMSYLENNSTYNAAGGADGAKNEFDLYGLKVMPIISAAK